jgi:hypothetical protein
MHFCVVYESGARALLLQFLPLNQGASSIAPRHGFSWRLVFSSFNLRRITKV